MHITGAVPDVEAMKKAASYLVGVHDFASFCGNPKMKKSTVREIYSIDISLKGSYLNMTFHGSGFLQYMVRILSGSYIVSGECKAVLTQVGHKAYAARLALEAKAGRKKKKTDMMKSLDNLVKIIGVVIVPLGIIMYLQSHFFLGHTIKNSVVSMVASLVGMIPPQPPTLWFVSMIILFYYLF